MLPETHLANMRWKEWNNKTFFKRRRERKKIQLYLQNEVYKTFPTQAFWLCTQAQSVSGHPLTLWREISCSSLLNPLFKLMDANNKKHNNNKKCLSGSVCRQTSLRCEKWFSGVSQALPEGSTAPVHRL